MRRVDDRINFRRRCVSGNATTTPSTSPPSQRASAQLNPVATHDELELAPLTVRPRFNFYADDDALRQLILHIAALSAGDEYFGAAKLNKLLFLADFLAFMQLGRPITGQAYQKLRAGPAPRRIVRVRGEMVADGVLAIEEVQIFDRTQKRPVPMSSADLSGFTPEELQLVGKLVDEWRGASALQISQASHEFIGWQMVKAGETIPYEAALVGVLTLGEDQLKHAEGLQGRAEEARRALAHGSDCPSR